VAGLWGVSAHRPSTTYALAVLHPSKLRAGHWARRGSRPPCLFPVAVGAWASPPCVSPRLTSSESEASHSLDVSLFLPSSQAERCWPALGAADTGVHDPRPPAPPFCMPAAGGTPLPQAFCVSLAAVCACRSMARQLQLLFPVGRPLSESRDSATLRIVAHRWAFLPPLAHLLFYAPRSVRASALLQPSCFSSFSPSSLSSSCRTPTRSPLKRAALCTLSLAHLPHSLTAALSALQGAFRCSPCFFRHSLPAGRVKSCRLPCCSWQLLCLHRLRAAQQHPSFSGCSPQADLPPEGQL